MTARCKECGILADTPKAAHDLIHALYESLAAHRGSLREVEAYAEASSKALAELVYVESIVLHEYGSGSDYYKERAIKAWAAAHAALAKNPKPSEDFFEKHNREHNEPVAGERHAQRPSVEARFFKRDGRWWRVVPADPTPEMVLAFENHGHNSTVEGYDAMLKAAPPYPGDEGNEG